MSWLKMNFPNFRFSRLIRLGQMKSSETLCSQRTSSSFDNTIFFLQQQNISLSSQHSRMLSALNCVSCLHSPKTKISSLCNSNSIAKPYPPLHIIQRTAKTRAQDRLVSEAKSKEYIELYLHKSITFLRVLCRFTRYSTFLFLFGTPGFTAAAQFGAINGETALTISGTLFCYFLLFMGQSYLWSSRIVGKIMISSDHEIIKFSHLTVFGQRRDIYVKQSEVIPVQDLSKRMVRVGFKNSSIKLLFLPQDGTCETNFGALEILLTGSTDKNK